MPFGVLPAGHDRLVGRDRRRVDRREGIKSQFGFLEVHRVTGEWISPLPDGLPVGQVVYSTLARADGSVVTSASVINGSYPAADGWHYDCHGIGGEIPALEGQPLGASCRVGEVEK
jgi:hypothetical protein